MYCKKCGRLLKPGERFCAKCGAENNLATGGDKNSFLNYGIRKDVAVKRFLLKPVLAIVVVLIVLVSFVIGCNVRSSNSPEKAIEAYYTLLAHGDLEGMSKLIPKDKQKIIEEAFQDAWDGEYADYNFDDIFSLYANWLAEHSTEESMDYYSYEGGVWVEMTEGLEDYLIYEKGDIDIEEIDDEEDTDIISLLLDCLGWDLRDQYRDENDLFDTMSGWNEVNNYDSKSVIEACEYDKLVRYDVKIKSKDGSGRSTDTVPTYVYRYDGKW